MIENRIHLLPFDQIKMPADRLRAEDDFDHANVLARQIQYGGLIHPILVNKETGELIAGRHRFLAFQINRELERPDPHNYLGWTKIPARYALHPTEEEITRFELVENIGSKKMDWKEVAKAIQLLHDMFIEDHDPAGTVAALIGWTKNYVHSNLRVAKYLTEGNDMIEAASGINAAINIIARLEERKLDEVSELIAGQMLDPLPTEDWDKTSPPADTETESAGLASPAESSVSRPASRPTTQPFQGICADFNDFASKYEGRRFNLVHCDFPYGIDYDKTGYDYAKAHSIYGDSKDLYFQLLDSLVNNVSRLVAESAHLIFWLDLRYKAETIDALSSVGFKVWQHSLIWHKSDNAGVLADPKRGPRHIHETALFAIRGDRKIVKPVGDTISLPTTRVSGHVSEKPLDVLKHFFKMFVDDTTFILDPTAGSFNSIVAAAELGASGGIGVELDRAYATRGHRILAPFQTPSEVNSVEE